MGKMTRKRGSPYSFKQVGKSGRLWNAHLNRIIRDIFAMHSLMILSNRRNIDQSKTFFCNSESGSMEKMLCK